MRGRSSRTHAAFALAAAVGCTLLPAMPARGAGETVQPRQVGTFARIRSDGAFTIHVTAGAATQRVVLRGDPTVVARTTTQIDGDTLVIGMLPGNYQSSPSIDIDVPALRGYTDSGASRVTIVGVGGASFDAVESGAGRLTVAGTTASLTIGLSGAGSIDTSALRARDVTVLASGAGSIDLDATDRLVANVSGVAHVRYAGDPAHVERHVSGVGSVEPR